MAAIGGGQHHRLARRRSRSAAPRRAPRGVCVWPRAHLHRDDELVSPERRGHASSSISIPPDERTSRRFSRRRTLIDGISFSSRGELFVSSPDKIRKVDPDDARRSQDYIDVDRRLPHGSRWSRIRAASSRGSRSRRPSLIGCPASDMRVFSSSHMLRQHSVGEPRRRSGDAGHLHDDRVQPDELRALAGLLGRPRDAGAELRSRREPLGGRRGAARHVRRFVGNDLHIASTGTTTGAASSSVTADGDGRLQFLQFLHVLRKQQPGGGPLGRHRVSRREALRHRHAATTGSSSSRSTATWLDEVQERPPSRAARRDRSLRDLRVAERACIVRDAR